MLRTHGWPFCKKQFTFFFFDFMIGLLSSLFPTFSRVIFFTTRKSSCNLVTSLSIIIMLGRDNSMKSALFARSGENKSLLKLKYTEEGLILQNSQIF